jgi:uncharacterized membrane-anchored protein
MRAPALKFLLFFLCTVLLSVASAGAQQPKQPYAWQQGPYTAKLGDQANFSLPAGYVFLGPQDTQRLLKEMGNFPAGSELGLVAGASEQNNWFVILRFVDAGYVKDDDAANWDADEMLASIKEGTEEANEERKKLGFDSLIVRGWEEKPRYDKASNKVVWAISAQEKDSLTVNFNTLALGRQGYMSMNMVGSLDQLPQLKPHVDTLLTNLNFVEGKRYADFNSATDKVAAVGLAALVAGAAFKSGLFAKLLALLLAFKKVIALAFIALVAFLAKFLKKREPPAAAV